MHFLLRFSFLSGFLLLWCLPTALRAADDSPAPQLHEPWHQVLVRHVTPDGRLDYSGMRKEVDRVRSYLHSLRQVKPNPKTWTPDQSKAFWINAYNAAATYLVLQHYPVTSINDIRVKGAGGSKSPWEAPVLNVGGQAYSLNQVEVLLRNQFHDPRVHFALMYAAVSCPPLLAGAYDGAHLNEQLDEQARRFINDPAYNELQPNQVRLSGLFEAYATEFGSGAYLLDFLNRYARTPVLPTARIEYLSFSWALNDRTSLSRSQALGQH
ncbi:DUF547 domain-containing protein [Hymenobacter weizhouensis]|uniref:DUF547 domain-containing protein n=1 Tax=Hymenobacter sp. YIM 151500-1 TaxID=2987689 RepID=UPI00222603C3|nr:DUF547 domain-containing protein [Hymenobacter sp. YIM 151500-1]UYZ65069.1 DUF547 domain-containing protein [Hymenobacter sp. YIM 151500-1]